MSFFSKRARDLNLDESIKVVVTLPSPTFFNVHHLTPFQKRRESILGKRYVKEKKRLGREVRKCFRSNLR